MGLDTVLFTMSLDSIANMPCNPSVGGTAKGHLVYEIDALGGEMGRAADMVTLQSRTLNLGKGAAVHSKRVQADRRKYQQIMKSVIEKTENLRLIQTEIVGIITEDTQESPYRKRIIGVKTKLGQIWSCEACIISAGTFLNGRIFIGDVNNPAGPDGLLEAKGLTDSLIENGIKMVRFKTGTPVRVKRSTIDLSKLEVQEGEYDYSPYSWRTPAESVKERPNIPCHIVYTNANTHKIIRDNIHRSALYSGQIHGTGPRYCPSIEDKLVRFADKERHQLFVEPVGDDTEEMYIQGFSTSLPTDVQYEMLRSLEGFENAEIMRYAYAIEYDCIDPLQLFATLEFKDISGLYGAGQFNGTSGYEEAAAQGLIAGLNASLSLQNKAPLILSRSESYIGTLIDDLVTKGTNEPYRMMTSRSEYRLLLRQDNADVRLTQKGYDAGLVTQGQYDAFLDKQEKIRAEIERLNTTYVSPNVANPLLSSLGLAEISTGFSLAERLKRPQLTYELLAPIDKHRPNLPPRVVDTVEVTVKYEGYIKRQISEVERREKLESKRLPADIDYLNIRGLRIEAAQKLSQIKPLTVGQAARISGVNPADVSVLLIHLGLKQQNLMFNC
jgi:tRNA uridine 5-carboxymethylaminomethyl modification enzyme